MSDAVVKWHRADLDNRMYCVIEDGKKIAMPRYYKDKLYTGKIIVHEATEEMPITVTMPGERQRVAWFTRKKMVEQELELARQGKLSTFRDKAESDIAAFNKMYHRAQQGRNKI